MNIKSASREAEARFALTDALSELTYAGAAGPVPGMGLDQSEAEFLAEVTAWIGELGRALERVRESVTETMDELTTLREQRQAIREFFGTAPLPDPFGSRAPGER